MLKTIQIFKCTLIIDIWIIAPGHGKSKIDGINEAVNTYLKQKMYMIGTEESNI